MMAPHPQLGCPLQSHGLVENLVTSIGCETSTVWCVSLCVTIPVRFALQQVHVEAPQQSHCVLRTTGAGFEAQHAHTACPQQSHCFAIASFMVTTVIPDDTGVVPHGQAPLQVPHFGASTGVVAHGHAPLQVPHFGAAMDAFKSSTILGL
jgi:hypothetical protein